MASSSQREAQPPPTDLHADHHAAFSSHKFEPRWAAAERRFLEVFYGKDFVPAYANIARPDASITTALPTHANRVSFAARARPPRSLLPHPTPPPLLMQQQKPAQHPAGRIPRPRTAELPPAFRRRLENFRELDDIAFVRPPGFGTPAATPVSDASGTSTRILGCDSIRNASASNDSFSNLQAKSQIQMNLYSKISRSQKISPEKNPPISLGRATFPTQRVRSARGSRPASAAPTARATRPLSREARIMFAAILNGPLVENLLKPIISNNPNASNRSHHRAVSKKSTNFLQRHHDLINRPNIHSPLPREIGALRIHIGTELKQQHVPTEFLSGAVGRFIARNVVRHYKLPRINNTRRITPRPGALQLSQTHDHIVSVTPPLQCESNTEHTIKTLDKIQTHNHLRIIDNGGRSFKNDKSESGHNDRPISDGKLHNQNINVESQDASDTETDAYSTENESETDEVDIMRVQEITPVAATAAEQPYTVLNADPKPVKAVQLKYRKRRRHIGRIFPIDLFLDHERTDRIIAALSSVSGKTEVVSPGFACRARCWPNPKGVAFESLECLLKSTKIPEMWKDCTIKSYDPVQMRFIVDWHSGRTLDNKPFNTMELPMESKLVSEILLPGESLHSLRWNLLRAKKIRDEFEFNLALEECAQIARPFLGSKLPEFRHDIIQHIFSDAVKHVNGYQPLPNHELLESHPKPQVYLTSLSDFVGASDKRDQDIHAIRKADAAQRIFQPICDELQSDFVSSEMRLLLLESREFHAFASSEYGHKSSETISRGPFVTFSDRQPANEPQQNEPNKGLGLVRPITNAMNPELVICISPMIRNALLEMHDQIENMFATSVLESMKSRVSRIHPVKKRLVPVDIPAGGFESRDHSSIGQQQQNLSLSNSSNQGGKGRRNKPTKAQAMKPVEPDILPSNYDCGDIKTTEIIPLVDAHGNVAFKTADFLDMCEWLQIDFDFMVRTHLPRIVDSAFRAILSQFGVAESNSDTPHQPTLSEQSKLHLAALHGSMRAGVRALPPISGHPVARLGLVSEDLSMRVGRLVSIMASTYVLPLIGMRIMETYRAIQLGQLHLLLSLDFDPTHFRDARGVQNKECNLIGCSVSLEELQIRLKDRLLSWTKPVPSILPAFVLSGAHQNYRFVEILFSDLVDDSIDACTALFKQLNEKIHFDVMQASDIPKLETSLEDYLDSVRASLESIKRIKKIVRFNPKTAIRGLFKINMDDMLQQLHMWSSKALEEIRISMTTTAVNQAEKVVLQCNAFFESSPPHTFEETRQAVEKYREMQQATNWVREQTYQLFHIKEFLDAQGWALSDHEFSRLLEAHQMQNKFIGFLKAREIEIQEANQRLSVSIGEEVETFLAAWLRVDGEANVLFSRPIKNHGELIEAIRISIDTENAGPYSTEHSDETTASQHETNRPVIPKDEITVAITTSSEEHTSDPDSISKIPATDFNLEPTLESFSQFVSQDVLNENDRGDSTHRQEKMIVPEAAPRRTNGALPQIRTDSPQGAVNSTEEMATVQEAHRRISLSENGLHRSGPARPQIGGRDSSTSHRNENLGASLNASRSMRRKSYSGITVPEGSNHLNVSRDYNQNRRNSHGGAGGLHQRRSSQQPPSAAGGNLSLPLNYSAKLIHSRSNNIPLEEIENPTAALKNLLDQIEGLIDAAEALIIKVNCIDNVPRASEMDDVMKQMQVRQELVGGVLQLRSRLNYWRSTAVVALDLDEIRTSSLELMRRIEDAALSNSPIAKTTYDDLKVFNECELPLLRQLKNPTLQSEHWQAIQDVIKFVFDPSKNSIRDVADRVGHASLHRISASIEPIEQSAGKEHVITNAIKEIDDRYNGMPIELESNARFGLTVVKSLVNHISMIESDLLTVNMMVSSKKMEKYVSHLKNLEAKLQTAAGAMHEWEQMQPLMINVHGFFESEEVRLQLSAELRRFHVFETGYRAIISNVEKFRLFSTLIAMNPDLPTSVAEIRHGLRKVIDDVQGWLDNKRVVFPRLFFVSDDELLELVSIAKEPSTVQHQLARYFYFSELTYTTDSARDYVVTGIRVPEGETMLFVNAIPTRGLGVEQWLARIEVECQATLRSILNVRMNQLKFENLQQSWKTLYENMVEDTPSQVVQLAFQILRTMELQACVEDDNPPSISDFVVRSRENILNLASLIRHGSSSQSIINCWKSLIATELYYRDWGCDLARGRIHDLTAFEWIKGLRYYHNEEGSVIVAQYLQQVQYGYEYLGAAPRICWSGVLEKCYATIWSAMEVKMGVTGYGPVSVGKTELFKDFTRAVGKFAVFFNCSQGVQPQILTRLMTSMAMTGCYLLMTYMDKLEENALNAVWHAVAALRELSDRKETSSVSYMGRIIKLHHSSNVCLFSTISASSIDRPDFMGIMRAQSRMVALAVPDQVAIARGMLHMAAFSEANELGARLAALFTMSGDQLSRQAHYDFSIRTTRTVIHLAEAARNRDASFDETTAIVNAIQNYIHPKLLYDDLPIFDQLISIAFRIPRSLLGDALLPVPLDVLDKIKTIRLTSLQQVVKRSIGQFIQVVQNGQHTIVLGKMSVGKTSLVRESASLLGASLHIVNPRALPETFLFGFEESTGYQKGIIESIVAMSSKTPNQKHWLFFDGPLEAVWADTVASMLQKEEGGALCLSNGKRVVLRNNMTMVIETINLDNASAGFVGRFNVVFIRHEWNWRVNFESWLTNFEDQWQKVRHDGLPGYNEVRIQLERCFSSFMEDIIRLSNDLGSRVSTLIVFKGTLEILECMLVEYRKAFGNRPESILLAWHHFAAEIEDIFHYAVTWSFGATIGPQHRSSFHQVYLRMLKVARSYSRLVDTIERHKEITVFDLSFDPKSTIWSSCIEPVSVTFPNAAPTRILAGQRKIMSLLLRHTKNVLLMGEIGSRKTTWSTRIVLDLCSQEGDVSIMGHAAPMLPNTTPTDLMAHLQKVLVSYDQATNLDHDCYVPVNKSSLIIFVDDMHIPSPSAEGSRTMWEFLRLFVDQKVYWANPHALRYVRKVGILGACDILQNGVVVIPERLMRHFVPIFFSEADVLEDVMHDYYNRWLQSLLDGYTVENIQSLVYSALNSTLDIVKTLKQELLLSSHSPFYMFTAHDLGKTFETFARVAPKYCGANVAFHDFWTHEIRRVYQDRIKQIDFPIFDNCLNTISKKYYHTVPIDRMTIFSDLSTASDLDEPQVRSEHVQATSPIENITLKRTFMQEVDESAVCKLIKPLQLQLSRSGIAVRNIALFPDGVAHFLRLDRVLSFRQNAHAILVCRPGMDISLDVVRLAAAARGVSLKEVCLNDKPTDLERWRSFMRKQVTDAGLHKKRVAICITVSPNMAVSEDVWGDLHSILDGARASNLWSTNEYEDLMNKIAHQYRSCGRNGRNDGGKSNAGRLWDQTNGEEFGVRKNPNDDRDGDDEYSDDGNDDGYKDDSDTPAVVEEIEKNQVVRSGTDADGSLRANNVGRIGKDVTQPQQHTTSIFTEGNVRQPTSLEILQHWARRVRSNVCVILRIDATDTETHQSLLRFPRIITRSTVDIYRSYSEKELLQLSSRQLSASFEGHGAMQSEAIVFSHMFVKMHQVACNSLTKDKIRILFDDQLVFSKTVHWFADKFKTQDAVIRHKITHMSTCLRRIHRLKDRVQRLVEESKQELTDLPDQLAYVTNELEGLKIAIEFNNDEIERLIKTMRENRETELRLALERELSIANAGLNEAKNAFEDTVVNLHTIKRNNLEELKIFVVPPPLLALVSDGLCLLFDRPSGWGEARKLLSSHTFLQRIVQFDYKDMPEVKLDKLRKIVEQPGFQAEKNVKVGPAVKCLCVWLKTMFRYCRELRSRLVADTNSPDSKNTDAARLLGNDDKDAKGEEELNQLRFQRDAMQERMAFLNTQKRELSGRLTLIKEIFSDNSIFDHDKPDQLSESQWIQQAFDFGDSGVTFVDSEVFKAHSDYEQELEKLHKTKQDMIKQEQEAMNSFIEICTAFESVKLSHIIELMEIKDSGGFTESAKLTLLKLINLPPTAEPEIVYRKIKSTGPEELTNSGATLLKGASVNPLFQRIAFYDPRIAVPTAVRPFQACRGAFLVREIAMSMVSYFQRKDRITAIINESQKEVDLKKAHFDQVWSVPYLHIPEYWTFEFIIQRFKEIHECLKTDQPGKFALHQEAISKNVLLRSLLECASQLTSYPSIDKLNDQLQADPELFPRAIASIKIGDQNTRRIVLESNINMHNIHHQIDKEFQRVYLDILSSLPNSISFRILIKMGEKNLSKLASVSRKWYDLVRQQQVWKWMSHENGWGLAFIYPKNMNWREFHHKLYILQRLRVPEITKSFDNDIRVYSGLNAYKRISVFLRRINEHARLDGVEQDTSKRMHELLQLELKNDIFMAIEDRFTQYLSSNENLIHVNTAEASTEHSKPSSPYKQMQNSSLRFKKAAITTKTAFGYSFPVKLLHELIVDKGSLLHCLHPNVDRIRKLVNRMDTSLTIDVGFGQFPGDTIYQQQLGPPEIPRAIIPKEFVFFHTLAEFLQIFHAYDRGIQMGKHIQFQVRFIRSLKLLCEEIDERIGEYRQKQNTLRGDVLLASFARSYLPLIDSSEQDGVCSLWRRVIQEQHPTRSLDDIISEYVPKFKSYSALKETAQIRFGISRIADSEPNLFIYDPNNVAMQLMDEIASNLFPGAIFLDALSTGFLEALKDNAGASVPVIIDNVGADSSLQTALTSFCMHRQRSAAEPTNLSKESSPRVIICSRFDILSGFEPAMTRLSFAHTEETLRATLMDMMMDRTSPKFHQERKKIRIEYEAQHLQLDAWFLSIIEIIKDRQAVEEELIHDIIGFQRRRAELLELKEKRNVFEAEVISRYAAFEKIISFVIDIWKVLARLWVIKPSYAVSVNIVLECFQKNLVGFSISSSEGKIDRSELDCLIDGFTSRLCSRISRSVASADRFPLLATLSMIKMRHQAIITKRDETVIMTLIQKRSELKDTEEFLKWIHLKFIPTLDDRPAFANALQELMTSNRRPSTLWDGAAAEIYERRLSPIQKFLLAIIALPQFSEDSIFDIFYETKVWSKGSHSLTRHLEATQENESSIVILVSKSPPTAIRAIVSMSETYENAHLQLSIMNEYDKQEGQWQRKVRFAFENGVWVLINLDSFWLKQIPAIYEFSKMVSKGFKIWIVGLPPIIYRLPVWVFQESYVAYDDDPISTKALAAKLEIHATILGESYRPCLLALLRFHFKIMQVMQFRETFPAERITIDDVALDIALLEYATSIRKKIPLETLQKTLFDTVYLTESLSLSEKSRLSAIWSESLHTYSQAVEIAGVPLEKMTHDGFINFLLQAKPHVFSQKSIHNHDFGNCIDIDGTSIQFCSKMTAMYNNVVPRTNPSQIIRHARYMIGRFLYVLQPSVNVRMIYESMNDAKDGLFRSFLLEEANNFLRLLRRVRTGLGVLLTSLSNGYPTTSAKRTLEAVIQNTIPSPWIRRSHPTSESLDVWIADIAKRIKLLEKWISLGQPGRICASAPFSLRALLQTLRLAFAEVSGASAQNIELCFDQLLDNSAASQMSDDTLSKFDDAVVLSGVRISNARATNGVISVIDYGVSEELPPFLVRARHSKSSTYNEGLLIPSKASQTHSMVSQTPIKTNGNTTNAGTKSQPTQEGQLVHRSTTSGSHASASTPGHQLHQNRIRTTFSRPHASQVPGMVHEFESIIKVTDECRSSLELLEDGSRPNTVCKAMLCSAVPKDILLQQGCEPIVSPSNNMLPEYLRPGYVDPNYLHSPGSMSDSLDRNVSHMSHHFTIYICSTADAENERKYLFETVFPSLSQEMSRRHIDLDYVDLRQKVADGHDTGIYAQLQAACAQIRRASLFIGVFGSKLGPLLQTQSLPAALLQAYPLCKSILENPKTMAEFQVEYSLAESNLRHLVKGRRLQFFYFRDPNFARAVPKSFRDQYEPENVEEKVRIEQLYNSLLKQHSESCVSVYPGHFLRVVGREVKMGGLQRLGERMRNDLVMCILNFVKQRRRETGISDTLGTMDFESYSGREHIIAPIVQNVCNPEPRLVHDRQNVASSAILIHGQSGAGKTALLSRLCHDLTHQNVVVLANFVRSWTGSFVVNSTVRRFCLMLRERLRKQSRILPNDPAKLRQHFVSLLKEAVFYGNQVAIIIDGIDRMVDSQGQQEHISWLPDSSELGNEACSNITWIFSAANDQLMTALCSKRSDAIQMPLAALSEEDKRKIIADRGKSLGLHIDVTSLRYLLEHKASDSPLYLKVILKEAQQNMVNGQFLFGDFHAETIWEVFDQIFTRLEKLHGKDTMRMLFSFLSFSRNGLREMEIVGLLGLSLIEWNIIFESVEEYFIKTSAGYIIVFHEQFTTAIKMRYLCNAEDPAHFHFALASYYIAICDPTGDLRWMSGNEVRAADITFHQLRAKRPVVEIARIMCSIGYISSVFISNMAHELAGYFSDAIKLAVDSEETDVRTKLTDYNFFVERFGKDLSAYPQLAYSLALSLPIGFRTQVRNEALDASRRLNFDPYLNCMSIAEDQLEIVQIGSHQSIIISVVVLTVGSIGKCCLTVASDATVKSWNIDTFLFAKSILVSPIGADVAVECCFSLNFAELVVFGTRNGHIFVFHTGTGEMHARIENSYSGGILFFSDDCTGVWQRGPLKTFEWLQFSTGLVIQAPLDPSDDERGAYQYAALRAQQAETAASISTIMPSTRGGKVSSILAKSMDSQKIAYLAIGRRRHAVVISAKTMREICRFCEDSLSEHSIGQFSIGKDLLAVILGNGDVMVWKIDSHSRVALVRIPTDFGKLACLSISVDESMLYFSAKTSVLGVASLQTGKVVKRLPITEKTVLDQICISTSKGKERFFLASGMQLFTCDNQSSLHIDQPQDGFDVHKRPLIQLRHSVAISAVLPMDRRPGRRVEAISASRDGRLVSWATLQEHRKLAPIHEVFVSDELTTCRVEQSHGFAIVTAGSTAIVWNIEKSEEVLRITHSHTLRDAILASTDTTAVLTTPATSVAGTHRGKKGAAALSPSAMPDSSIPITTSSALSASGVNTGSLTLYTWTIDGQFFAWKVLGRSDLFFTYDPTPLFTVNATALPDQLHSLDMREILMAKDSTILVLDALLGTELRRFSARGRESVIDLSWRHVLSREVRNGSADSFSTTESSSAYRPSQNAMENKLASMHDTDGTNMMPAIASMSDVSIKNASYTSHAVYATKTTLFADGDIWSYGGSLVDNIQIDGCKCDVFGTHIGYYGIELGDEIAAKMNFEKVYFGIVVIITDRQNQSRRRLCMLRHENARVVKWSFMHDPNFIVTIATDLMIRVWEVREGDHREGTIDATVGLMQLSNGVSSSKQQMIGHGQHHRATQINGSAARICAMFPLRSPCTSLSVASNDYVMFVGNEQGDVLQFRLERPSDNSAKV